MYVYVCSDNLPNFISTKNLLFGSLWANVKVITINNDNINQFCTIGQAMFDCHKLLKLYSMTKALHVLKTINKNTSGPNTTYESRV